MNSILKRAGYLGSLTEVKEREAMLIENAGVIRPMATPVMEALLSCEVLHTLVDLFILSISTVIEKKRYSKSMRKNTLDRPVPDSEAFRSWRLQD